MDGCEGVSSGGGGVSDTRARTDGGSSRRQSEGGVAGAYAPSVQRGRAGGRICAASVLGASWKWYVVFGIMGIET